MRPHRHFEILKIWIFEVYIVVMRFIKKDLSKNNSKAWLNFLKIGLNQYFGIFEVASWATPIFWIFDFFKNASFLYILSEYKSFCDQNQFFIEIQAYISSVFSHFEEFQNFCPWLGRISNLRENNFFNFFCYFLF